MKRYILEGDFPEVKNMFDIASSIRKWLTSELIQAQLRLVLDNGKSYFLLGWKRHPTLDMMYYPDRCLVVFKPSALTMKIDSVAIEGEITPMLMDFKKKFPVNKVDIFLEYEGD